MKGLNKSETANPNYLAQIVRLKGLRKHNNADKLQCVTINGCNVITGLEAQEDDWCVYFPLECSINKEFLSWSNSFEDKTLNANKEEKGFFNNKGRVRCLKLRGERSEGYIIPILLLMNWLKEKGKELGDWSNIEGVEFDYFDDIMICEKYIPIVRSGGGTGPKERKSNTSFIVDGQFRFHSDTEQLAKNIEKISPEDLISISYKMHGTSFISSNVLCNTALTYFQRLLIWLGFALKTTEYKNIYSSRKVIKNDTENKVQNHYYGYDLWGDINEKVKHALNEGISIYGEAVGYTKNGGAIQHGYDYGCKPEEFDVYIYKVTYTNTEGKVFKFSWDQIKRFCKEYDLKYVPEKYYGKAKDLFNISLENHWHETFLENLRATYLEKDCYMCDNKVPEEGIVVAVDNGEAFKLKSFRFLEIETNLLDKGEVDLETTQTIR